MQVLEVEIRDEDKMKSQFLGLWTMPIKQLNARPQAEEWVALVPRPDKPDKPAQGEMLVRWNFTRTVPLMTAAMKRAEERAAHMALVAAAPTPRERRLADQREWDALDRQSQVRNATSFYFFVLLSTIAISNQLTLQSTFAFFPFGFVALFLFQQTDRRADPAAPVDALSSRHDAARARRGDVAQPGAVGRARGFAARCLRRDRLVRLARALVVLARRGRRRLASRRGVGASGQVLKALPGGEGAL